MSENEDTTYQKLWDAAQVVLRGKSIALNTYILKKEEERYQFKGISDGSVVKNLPAKEGDTREVGSIPGSGRSPGGAYVNLHQYSCLENLMDRGSWWALFQRVAKS